MLFGLSRKTVLEMNAVPDRNPLFVQTQDGGIRNGFTIRLLNKRQEARTFALSVAGLPDARIAIVGDRPGQQPPYRGQARRCPFRENLCHGPA